MQPPKTFSKRRILAGVALFLGVISGCSKDPVTPGLNPTQDSPKHDSPAVVTIYRYSGMLYRYFRRYATGSQQVLIDSTFIPATAALGRTMPDTMTATVDSMTQQVYKFAATGPGSYTVWPCCRPSKQVVISSGFDSLHVRYQVTDPMGGPYYFLEEFSGKKR